MDWFSLAPKIAASDLFYQPNQAPAPWAIQMGDYNGAQTMDPGYFGAISDARSQDYGLWNNLSTYNDNFQIRPIDANSFEAWIKSGDKEATKIKYALDGGYWNPTESLGTEYWDTNPGEWQDILRAGVALTAPYAIGTALTAGGAAGGGLQTLGEGAVAPLSSAPTIAEPGLLAGVGGSFGLDGLASGISGIADKIGYGNLIKGGLTLAGGLLGGAGGSSGSSGGSVPTPAIPQPVPKMYGEGTPQGMLGGNWGPQGPTETERRMRQQYLPGLLGGSNPWGY